MKSVQGRRSGPNKCRRAAFLGMPGCCHVEVHGGILMRHPRIMTPLSSPDQSALALNGTLSVAQALELRRVCRTLFVPNKV
jgi:hypothetical protein